MVVCAVEGEWPVAERRALENVDQDDVLDHFVGFPRVLPDQAFFILVPSHGKKEACNGHVPRNRSACPQKEEGDGWEKHPPSEWRSGNIAKNHTIPNGLNSPTNFRILLA